MARAIRPRHPLLSSNLSRSVLSHPIVRVARSPLATLLLLISACATTGSTFGSGVGDEYFERPPYTAGGSAALDSSMIAHLPVSYQRGATQPEMFDLESGPGSPVESLVAEMTTYLDSLDVSIPLELSATPPGTPPDVHFGCPADPFGDCLEGDDPSVILDRDGTPRLLLAVGRPSADWIAWASRRLEESRASRLLVLTLETGQYFTHQTNLRGDKVVRLGTGYEQEVPWLTSLDAPVQVLQLTGTVVGPDGRAQRIGAEGLYAQRTGILMSGFGVQELLTEDDVRRVRAMRRDDLPGRPLVWQVALRNLVAQLAGRPELAVR